MNLSNQYLAYDMTIAELPVNEQDRLDNLYSYELLDTLPEKDYDDITRLASYICDTPVSLVTLIDKDRQWMKSTFGVELNETLREHAFCSHTILKPDEMMMVPNMANDERFFDHPFVTGDYGVMFYAGVPLLTEEGYAIGSLCVLDNKPRDLNEGQQAALKTLANQTMRLIQLHKKTKALTHSRLLMQQVNTELEKFAQVTAEKLVSPCDNAIEFTDLIAEKYSDALDADGNQILSLIKYSCESIKTTVEETMQRANRISLLQDSKTVFTFAQLAGELTQKVSSLSTNVIAGNKPDNDSIYFYKNLLLKILAQIITASSEFSHRPEHQVEIAFEPDRQQYIFCLTDNGSGVPVFSRNGELVLLQSADHVKKEGDNYLSALSSARQIITSLAGTLDMSFSENKSTVFTIRIPK